MVHDQANGGSGISLKFGQAAKQKIRKVQVNEPAEASQQEYLKGFRAGQHEAEDEGKTSLGVDGATKRVIPNQGNAFRGGPRAFNPNRFLPEEGGVAKGGEGADRFELAALEAVAPVTYGLSTRGGSKEQAQQGKQEEGNETRTERPARGQRKIASGRDWETELFKEDVAALPDVASLEAYEAMPVEAFGEAMLRGMGWSETLPEQAPKAREFIRRPQGLGLGATEAPRPEREKKYIKPGETRGPKKDMVVYGADGNIKHTRTADDKLVERIAKGPAVGKTMRVLKGRHGGLLCQVTAIQPQVEGRSQTASVRLLPSHELVSVRLKELGEKEDTAEAGRKSQKQIRDDEAEALPMVAQHLPKDREAGLAEDRSASISAPGASMRNDKRDAQGERPWLAANIRVKFIDKRMGGGKLYMKKGVVTDVVTPTRCSIFLDSGDRTVDAEQSQLETVVPKVEGTRVLLLQGRLRGQRARLLKRNTESCQAAVQLTEDLSVHKVGFDDFSEYLGDPGEEE